MEVEELLRKEAENLFKQEESMKRTLEDYRRIQRTSSKLTWRENLQLVCSTPQERISWAENIEKDGLDQKKSKQISLSENFVKGPKKNPAFALKKLLLQAAVKNKIILPKSFMNEFDKSGLFEKYKELRETS